MMCATIILVEELDRWICVPQSRIADGAAMHLRYLAFLMPKFGRPKSLASVGVDMARRPTQRIVRHAASGSYGSE